MTKDTVMDKDRLAAFADGELSPEEAAAVVMHLADHPADQAYVDEVMATNIALAQAFAAPMSEPVPQRFRDLILPEEAASPKVVPFPARRSPSRLAGFGAAALALAAGLVAVAFLPGTPAGFSVGPVAGTTLLGQALMAASSGVATPLEDGSQLTILATMPATSGHCREFEVISADARTASIGLACSDGAGWTVDVLLAEALTAPVTPDGSFAPASGASTYVMDTWLDRRGAGIALSPDAEAALIAQDWVQ